MKAIFKGNKFAIQWTIKDAVTSLPFDFTGMFVEYILYSDSYKGRIVGATTNINKMQAEIPANILPVGVYNIICKYRNSINEGQCIYRNAFQITRNPEFIECDNIVVIESFSAPLKLENMDINYLGHFTSSDLLIDCNQPSWALVGKLNEAEPWFFYTEDAIPAGSQYGWNNMSDILGKYNLLTSSKEVYHTTLFDRFTSYQQIDGASVTKEDITEINNIIGAIKTNKSVSFYYNPSKTTFNYFGTLDCYFNETETEFGCYIPTEDGYVVARCNLSNPNQWSLVRGQSTGEGTSVTNYNQLKERPSINGVTLTGNHNPAELDLATVTQFNQVKDISNHALDVSNQSDRKSDSAVNTANQADTKADEAINTAEEAKSTAELAKTAVRTLEGLANATEAQQVLAAQVVQIEENKQNIASNKAETDEKITELGSKVGSVIESSISINNTDGRAVVSGLSIPKGSSFQVTLNVNEGVSGRAILSANGFTYRLQDNVAFGEVYTFIAEEDIESIYLSNYTGNNATFTCGVLYGLITSINDNKNAIDKVDKKLDSFKDEFENFREYKLMNLNFTVGAYYRYADGVKVDSASYAYVSIPVVEEEVYKINTDGGSTVAIISAFDSQGGYIQENSIVGTGNPNEYIYKVPSGVASIVVTAYNTDSYKKVYRLGEISNGINSKFEEVNNQFDSLKTYNQLPISFTEGAYYRYADGVRTDAASYAYLSIQVKEGDVYRLFTDGSTSVAAIAAYDKDNNYVLGNSVAMVGGESIFYYKVPKGIAKCGFSVYNSSKYKSLSKLESVGSKINKADMIDNTTYYRENFDLDDGVMLKLEGNYHKTNYRIASNIRGLSGFNSILIGKGYNTYNGYGFKITPTTISILDNTSEYGQREHSLSISERLDILINTYVKQTDESSEANGDGDATYCTIELFDGANRFTLQDIFFVGAESPYLQVNGGKCNVDMYYWCNDLKEKLWCYGDSYFSIAQTRWTYWVTTRGGKALFNACPGYNSNQMYEYLVNDIKRDTPKHILWALGMNDNGDSDNQTPSTDWKSVVDKVIEICSKNNVIPVFATIPSVPNKNHEGKNYWIRNSGYKYIDFAKAVSLDATNGTWFNGMLNEDNIHPTKNGAKALSGAAWKLFISNC